jgi:hypothetical protein
MDATNPSPNKDKLNYSSYEPSVSASESSESLVEQSHIDGRDTDSEVSNSVALKSKNNTPRVSTITTEKLTKAELFSNTSASVHLVDKSKLTHSARVANVLDQSGVSQESQAPKILPASEPRLEARVKYFTLGVSAVIGLSMPFIMLLSPKDLTNRAAWVGVAAASGLFLGTVYCYVDYAIGLREQIRLQRNAASSPA